MKSLISLLCLSLLLALANPADAARRFGGGSSMGKQSNKVSQREATPPANAPAATPAVATPRPAAPPPTAAAPRRPWGAMLGGLAAGLGLAWLAHSLGFGEVFGHALTALALGLLALMLLGFFLRWRRGPAPAASPFAFQGAAPLAPTPHSLRQYSEDAVGNDASARPWERSSLALAGAARPPDTPWGVPADFDTEGFLTAAKGHFMRMQQAWSRADLTALRDMLTDEMLAEVRTQVQASAPPSPPAEVLGLQAHLLGIETQSDGYMASVEFSGLNRDDPSAGLTPFREVWNLTKPLNGAQGWLVAGVQALQ